MQTKITHNLFLLLCFFQLQVLGQNSNLQHQHLIDSLKKELLIAKNDTTKLKLQYELGMETLVNRIGYWDTILYITRNYKLRELECGAYIRLAILNDNQVGKLKSIEYLNKALEIAEKNKYDNVIIVSLSWLSFIYKQMFNYPKALESCYKNLKASELQKSNGGMASAYYLIAEIYEITGDSKKAITMNLKSLELYKKLKDYGSAMQILIRIGTNYQTLKDYKNSIYYYREASKYLRDLGNDNYNSASIYAALGAAYQMGQQLDSAFYYYTKYFEIAKQRKDEHFMASALTLLAGNSLEKGNVKKAKREALEALTKVKKIGFKLQIPILSNLLKKIYIKEGNYKAALEAYELNIKTRDSLSNEKVRSETSEKEFTYNLEKKENENKLLASQNQIQTLEIKQNRYFLISLAALLILTLGLGYLFYRQNKFRTEQRSVYLEQKLLRTQMNPHFIFNSLNTIQQFIITHENDTAQLYLSKFSRLMRKLLESNTKETITLKEEIEILEKYLEIESLRFNNVFSYTINVKEGVEPSQLNIPHFLTQPFVENAIWHGLLPKDGDKQLTITFEKQNEKTLLCSIEDNGVGRQNELRQHESEEKQSLAIGFIKQRLGLLSKVKKTNYTLELIDKKDEQGNNAGLTVRITLPILNTLYNN
jgi:tetratricopeptide (TPR) repeat protein